MSSKLKLKDFTSKLCVALFGIIFLQRILPRFFTTVFYLFLTFLLYLCTFVVVFFFVFIAIFFQTPFFVAFLSLSFYSLSLPPYLTTIITTAAAVAVNYG
jgi:hypothetical protein